MGTEATDFLAPNSLDESATSGLSAASLRFSTHQSATNEKTSAALLPQISPFNPHNQVAGTPTTSDATVAIPRPRKTDSGDSMARRASDGPKVELQKICPRAKAGSK